MDTNKHPFGPMAATTPAQTTVHKFRWYSIAVAILAFVLIEFLFIVTGRLWVPVIRQYIDLTWLPLLFAVLMGIVTYFILRACRAMTGVTVALLIGALAVFAMLNVIFVNVILHL